MKFGNEERKVLTNAQNESKFTINASAQAFKILSDGLYEHKVAAIIRELSCNAYDSHIENGNQDEPFRVVLPNELHPHFTVEDFGIGLDHEGVTEVYTSYFTSTKDNSNDQTGAFGLGSKTPFSYTSQFTITARKDGVERLYTAYLNDSGAPCVNILSEQPTSSRSGVKISVPVSSYDVSSFYGEAAFILSFFETQPEVSDKKFEFLCPNIINDIKEGGGFCIKNNVKYVGSSLYNNKMYALMGGVCYRFNEDDIIYKHQLDEKYHLSYKYLTDILLKSISNYSSSSSSMFFHFDIGELEPAASRETLSMSTKVKEALTFKLLGIAEQRRIKDQEYIDLCNHPSQAIQYVNNNYPNLMRTPFVYNGELLDNYKEKIIESFYGMKFCNNESKFTFSKPKLTRATQKYLSNIINTANITGHIKAVYFNVGDKKTHLAHYIRHHVIDKNKVSLCFESPMTKQKMIRIERYLGVKIKWIHLEQLKKDHPIAKKTQPGTSKKLDDSTVKTTYISNMKFGIRHQDDINLTEDIVYYINSIDKSMELIKTNNNIVFNIDDFKKICEFIHPGETVILVQNNNRTKRKLDSNNITDFYDCIESFISKYSKKYLINDLVRRYANTSYISLLKRINISDTLKEKYKDTLNIINEDVDLNLRFSTFFMRSTKTKMKEVNPGLIDEETIGNSLDDILEDIYILYPMTKFAFSNAFCHFHDSQIKMINDYIKDIDSLTDK